ncbi:ParB/RepB/Spo0J family partition protein [Nostoc spongiaeforme FACHB-130]|uniref:ParB/RepB/Spo0J family partition protein n=1 Tax=Nostoc spongiaeforme FACHB-130 TaxID=1357510 RepID=A0ABR8G4K0_9NOSO|nr:ParB/RepB/Spo0J family partition protein [Nostoc spongiaeforme]MBD2598148.1 ParB/RepB/Spo0J family partition protein [Nostoc spongiaeforme FACHB-130]
MARRNSLKDDWKFEATESNVHQISIDSIILPSNQPRRYFDPQKLQQLKESISTHGILEPLLVRPAPKNGQYELVAGERRYRAAKEAGLTSIPVTVRELTDDEAVQLALVENLQREDLNPVEETEGILQLLSLKLKIDLAQVPSLLYRMRNEVVGNTNQNVLISSESQQIQAVFDNLAFITWESFVTTRLTLLNLPSEILSALRTGRIAYTKAQAIARLKDEDKRRALLEDAITQNLSLAQIRERLKAFLPAKEEPQTLKQKMQEITHRFQKAKAWDDPKKQKRLEKLLMQMEAILAED